MLRKRKILVLSSLVCIGAAICFLAWHGANSDDDTMAMRIVGKWIQEYSSQAALLQTEFFPDGRVIIKKHVLIAPADMERYYRLLPASVESLRQPQRKRTYYWVNDIALRGGKYLQGTAVEGSWLIENGRLVQGLESNVSGTIETSGRIITLSEGKLVLSYEKQGQEVSFCRQDRWETATAALGPWLKITGQTDSTPLGIDSQGASLRRTAEIGKITQVSQLLADGVNVDAKDPAWGDTALHKAAENGHRDVVALLLAKGADMNARTLGGWTPLHKAAWEGHQETVELLINEGAEVNARATLLERTPMYFAIDRGHKEVAELIRRHGGVEYPEHP